MLKGFIRVLTVFLVLVFHSVLHADINDAKVAEYSFNSNAINVNTGLNGQESGEWSYGLGLKGTAISLDNSPTSNQSYVELDEFDPNSLGTANEMSLSFWVRPLTTSGNHCYVGKHTSSGSNILLLGRWNYGKLRVQLPASSAYTDFTDTEVANVWAHYVLTTKKVTGQTQTEAKVYKNGTLIGTTTLNDTLDDMSGKSWVVGQDWDSSTPSDFTNGDFDELSFYNRVLTSTEVADLYSEQNNKNVYQGRYVSYSFDNNTNISTYGNSITNVGTTSGTITYQAGHLGSSVKLTNNGYINLADFDPSTAGTSGEFSFEVRVKPTDTSGNHCYIGKHTSGGSNQLLFGFWNGGVIVQLNGVYYRHYMDEPFGVWTHWTVVGKKISSSQTEISLYQDGVKLFTQTLSTVLSLTAGGKPWVVGQEWDSSNPSDYSTGEFDEVAFYSRALTAEEVATRAQYPRLEDNLLAHYTFDGDFDSDVKEYGYYPAQGNNLTLSDDTANYSDGNAAVFNGVSGSYLVAGTDDSDIGASELHDPRLFYSGTENRGWAISFWVKPTTGYYSEAYYSRNFISGNNDYYMFNDTSSPYYLRLYKGGSSTNVNLSSMGAGETEGSWQHYVINYIINGSITVAYAYKNGEYAGSGTFSSAYSSITDATTHRPWTFGAEYDYNNSIPNNLFHGRMDNIRFYGRTLNEGEVNTLYNNCEMVHSHRNSSGYCECDYGYELNAEETKCEDDPLISGVVGGSGLKAYYPFTTQMSFNPSDGSVYYNSASPTENSNTTTSNCEQCLGLECTSTYVFSKTFTQGNTAYLSGSTASSFTCEFNNESCLATSDERYLGISLVTKIESYGFSTLAGCSACRSDETGCPQPLTSYSSDLTNLGTSNVFSIGFWAKPSNPDFNIRMYRYDEDSGQTQDLIDLEIVSSATNKKAVLSVSDVESSTTVSRNFPMESIEAPRDQNAGWHYYTIVFNSDGNYGVYLYINGEKQNYSPVALTTGYLLFMDTRNEFMMMIDGGGIDELVLYNRALSDGEINDHYFGFICPTGEKQSGANCVDACGDGIVDAGEQCDDGNSVDTDACTNSCLPNVCGDGSVYTGVEACDDGDTDNNDACKNDCTLNTCGDGYINSGVEVCELGDSESCSTLLGAGTSGTATCGSSCDSWVTANNCTTTFICSAKPTTGTSWNIVSSYIQTYNGTAWVPADDSITEYNASASSTECRYKCNASIGYVYDSSLSGTDKCRKCGDGIVEGVEVCDDGANNGSYNYCKSDCSGVGDYCGDGIMNGPEICDGTDYNGETCVTQVTGADGGSLSCNACQNIGTTGCLKSNQTCTGLPSNATWNTVAAITQHWNPSGGWYPSLEASYNETPSTEACRFVCELNYSLDQDVWGNEICSPDTREYTCSTKPANSQWNTVGSYTQTWDGSSWMPIDTITEYNETASTEACRYSCGDFYQYNGVDGCVDIDECWEGTYDCTDHSVCVNDIGENEDGAGYHCDCIDGYTFNFNTETCDPDCDDDMWVEGEECDPSVITETSCRNINSDYKDTPATCSTSCQWDESNCENVCDSTICGITWATTLGGNDITTECSSDGTCGSSGITCTSTGSLPEVSCGCPTGYHLEQYNAPAANINHQICASDTKVAECPSYDMPENAEFPTGVVNGAVTLTWNEASQNYGVLQPDSSYISVEEACSWSCATGFVKDQSQGLHFTHADFGLSWDDSLERPLYEKMEQIFSRLDNMGDETVLNVNDAIYEQLDVDIQERLASTFSCDDTATTDTACAEMTYRVMAALTSITIKNVPLVTYDSTQQAYSAVDATTVLSEETRDLIKALPTTIPIPWVTDLEIALVNRRVIEDALNYLAAPSSTKVRRGYNAGELVCVNKRIDNCTQDHIGIFDLKTDTTSKTIMPESYYYIYSENLTQSVVSTYENGDWNIPQCPWTCKPGTQESVASTTHCEPDDQLMIPDTELKKCASRSIAKMADSSKATYAQWLKEICAKDDTALDGVNTGICTFVNGVYDVESIIDDLLPGDWQLVIWTVPEENEPVYFADAQLVKDMDCSYSTLNEGDMSGTEDKDTYIRNLEGIQYFISLESLNLEWQAVSALDPLGEISSTGYLQEPMQLIFGEDDNDTPLYLDDDLEQIANGVEITVRKFEIVPNINSNTCGTGYRKVTDSIVEQYSYNSSTGKWYREAFPSNENTDSELYLDTSQIGDNACLDETYLTDGTYSDIRVQNCSAGSGRGIIVETATSDGSSQRAIVMCQKDSDGTLPYARVRKTLESSDLTELRLIMVAELGLVRYNTMLDKSLGNFWFDTEPAYSDGVPALQHYVPKYSIELTADNEECGSEEKAYTLKLEGDVLDMFNGVKLTDLDSSDEDYPATEEIVICADASTGELPNVIFQQNDFTTFVLRLSTPKNKGLKTLNLSYNTHNHASASWSTHLGDISPLIFHPKLEYLSLEGTSASVDGLTQRDLTPLVHNHSMTWLNLSMNKLQSGASEVADPFSTDEDCEPESETYFNETPQCFSRTGELRSLRNMTELKTFIAPAANISYFNQRLDTVHRQCSCGDIKNYKLPKDIVIGKAIDVAKVPAARHFFRKNSATVEFEALFDVPYRISDHNCVCDPCKLIEDQVRKLWEDYDCDTYTNCSFGVDPDGLNSAYIVDLATEDFKNTCEVEKLNGDFFGLQITGVNDTCPSSSCELTKHTRLFRNLDLSDMEYKFYFSPEYNPDSGNNIELNYDIEIKYDVDLFNEMMRDNDTNVISVNAQYSFNGIVIDNVIDISKLKPTGGIAEDVKTQSVSKVFSPQDLNTVQKFLEFKIERVNSAGVYGYLLEYPIPMFIKSITIKNLDLEIGNGTLCEENIVGAGEDEVETCECNVYTGKCDGKKWFPGTLAEQWVDLEYLDLSYNTLDNDYFVIQHADSRMGNIETTCGDSHTVFVGKYDGISYFSGLKGLFLHGNQDLTGLPNYEAYQSNCDVSQDRLAGLIPLLPELKYVDIGDTLDLVSGSTVIPDVPDFNNANLKELDISENLMSDEEDFRVSLSKQHNIEYLDLSETRFPSSQKLYNISFIDNMQNLQYLNLSDNGIYAEPYLNNFKLNHFSRLEHLDLSDNYVVKLGWLGTMPALKSLNVSGNDIQEIEQVSFLADLEKLDITAHCIVDSNGVEDMTRINGSVDSEIELTGASTVGTNCTTHTVTATCGNGIREGSETCDAESILCRKLSGQEGKAGYAYCNDTCTGWNVGECETTDEDFPDEDVDEEIPDIDTDLNCAHGVIMIASNGDPFCLCDDGYHMEGDHCVRDSVNGMPTGSAGEIMDEAGTLSDDENDIKHINNLKEEDPDEVPDDDTETIEDVGLIYNCSYPTVENCFSESYQRDDCGILYRGVCKDMMNFCMPVGGQCCIPEKDDSGNLLSFCKPGSREICQVESVSGVTMCSRKDTDDYLGCHFLEGDGACGALISNCITDVTDISCHTNADCGCGRGDDYCLYQCKDALIAGLAERRCVAVACDSAVTFDEGQCAVVQDDVNSPTVQICLAKDLAEQIHLIGSEEDECHGYPEIVSLEFDENNNLTKTVSCQLPSPMLKFSDECGHSFVGCLNNIQARVHNLFRFNTEKMPIAGDSRTRFRCGNMETGSDKAFCGAFSKNGLGSEDVFEDETSTDVTCNEMIGYSDLYGTDPIDIECPDTSQQ